jgi:MFS family permease
MAYLSDGLGRRKTFALSAAGAMLTVVAYTQLHTSMTTLLLLGFPLGLFQAGIVSGMGACFTELFPAQIRGTAGGFSYNFGRGIGALVPAAVGVTSTTMGLAPSIGVWAVLSYIVVFVVAIFLAEPVIRSLKSMSETAQPRNGGQILVEALVRNAVDTVYCVPGESYLPVLDALRDVSGIRTIVTRLAMIPLAAVNVWAVAVDVFLIGMGGALATVLQTRLMDVAGDAQGLAAALNHSAFNTANALGPFLGGLTIARGYGWTSPGWVGSLLAIGGLLLWLISALAERKRNVSSHAVARDSASAAVRASPRAAHGSRRHS